MASVSNHQGRRSIQFACDDGKRRTIRLGKCDGRTALGIKLHVERLIESKRTGMPLHAETAFWLRRINDELHDRIARVGLCDPRTVGLRGQMPIAEMLDAYIKRRTDLKPWSVKMLVQARGKLVSFFGEKKPIGAITVGDAGDFKRAMAQKLSTATVAKLINLARQFFKDAVARELLDKSPFAGIKAGSQKNPLRQRFIARETVDRAISAATDLEWKLIIALARYGGLRVPTEVLALQWDDIYWEVGRIHIRASKTEHHVGHEERDTPLFPEL